MQINIIVSFYPPWSGVGYHVTHLSLPQASPQSSVTINPSSALAGHPADPLPMGAFIKTSPRSGPYTSLTPNSKIAGLTSQVLDALIPHRIWPIWLQTPAKGSILKLSQDLSPLSYVVLTWERGFRMSVMIINNMYAFHIHSSFISRSYIIIIDIC